MTSSARTHRSRAPWWIGGAVALVIAIAAIVAVTAGGDDTPAVEAGIEQVRTVSIEGTSLPLLSEQGADPAIGSAAPVLSGQSFDGTLVTTAGDRPRLLVFVAHWCSHCQAEVPRLVQWAADDDVPAGLDVIGVSTAVHASAPNFAPSAWLDREQFPWPVLADDPDDSAANAMGLSAFPYFVLLDAEGRVALRTTGEIEPADLVNLIEEALASSTG